MNFDLSLANGRDLLELPLGRLEDAIDDRGVIALHRAAFLLTLSDDRPAARNIDLDRNSKRRLGPFRAAVRNLDHDAPDSPESRLLGGPVQKNKDKAAKANPITYVSGKVPPILVIHGDLDSTVPYGQSVILVEALGRAGAPVTFRTVRGAGHGSGFGPPEIQATQAFFITHLEP